MQRKRRNKEYREKEKKANVKIMTRLRKQLKYRIEEKEKNKEINQRLRQKEKYRFKEKDNNKQIMKRLRQKEEYRFKEKEINKEIMKRLRQKEEYRFKEKEINKEIMKRLRQKEKYRFKEKEKDNEVKKILRKDEEFRSKEKQKDSAAKKKMRADKEFRSKEKQRDSKVKKILRADKTYTEREREKNKINKKKMRQKENFRAKEKEKDAKKKQIARETESFRESERQKDREKKRRQRHIDLIKFRELVYNNLCKANTLFSRNQLKFLQERKSTPSIVCCCCEGLFFEHSVVKFDVYSFMRDRCPTFFSKIYNTESSYICITCKRYTSLNKIPKLSTSNGIKYVNIPDCVKNLSPLEERMVSPYINFMQIRALKSFALNPQLGLKGSVVNIPIEIKDILQVLPRTFDNMATIQVKLKRHMLHSTDYMFETIRPAVVCEALEYLVKTPLYKKYKIEVDANFFHRYDGQYEEKINFVVDEADAEGTENLENNALLIKNSTDDIDNLECDEEVLVMDRNYQLNDHIKITAPGQGKRPIPWHMVEDLDELTFPTIFGGYSFSIPPEINISYSDRVKSECRRKDRRSCVPTRLLYMAKKKLEKSCLASINVCLRKTKFDKNINVSNVTNPDFMKSLISFDAGYKFLNKIRSSPSYWESRKKELLAMIRQLGKPTLFLTLSAGEKIWPELIKTLYLLRHGESISLEEACMLSENEKTLLIRNDPVTCARYFDYKITKFKRLINQKKGFFGSFPVKDSYSRVEFQMRGSPHEHIFLWLTGAPSYESVDSETSESCIHFIDDFITCESDINNPLITLQKHKHSHTCYKGKRNKSKCRFNFPIPIMPRTMILEPLSKDLKTPELKTFLKKIRALMNYLYKNPEDISFQNVLTKLNMDEETYILSIRCSLKRTQVFLKRSSQEVGINCYNKNILNLFESNMDLQFILEEYGLASYIINYVSKIDSGLSKLLRDASSDIKDGNTTIKEKFRNIANVFLNSNLMSSQEAAYHALSLPLSKMSRQCIFINTSPINERVLILKSKEKLQNLSGDSTDIFMKDVFKKYTERPKDLENICLADFCSFYTNKNRKQENEDSTQLQNGETFVQKKKNSIIRYRRYKFHQDPTNYFREQLLLFFPWRHEIEEIENGTIDEKYYLHADKIEENRKKYLVIGDETLEMALEAAKNEILEIEEEDINDFETNSACNEQHIDIFEQCGEETIEKKILSRYTNPKRISEEEMYRAMQKLNQEQRSFVLHVLHSLKTMKSPIRIFLSGSAGVGKSTVINCLYQIVTRYFDNMPGGNKDKIVVLLCAPSGRAAFLIKGVTLHTAFALPVTQFSGQMPELSQDIANTIREKLSHVKLIIIDEISMVGSTLFTRVDTRLRQIKGVNLPFGGISIICVGDLHQLPPVMDTHIFKCSNQIDLKDFFDINPLWEEFYYYELLEIMRQKNEANFIRALNNLAVDKMEDNDIQLFKSREMPEECVPVDAVRLFSENRQVELFNNKKIETFPGEKYFSKSEDRILGKLNDKTKSSILNSLQNKNLSDVNGLPHNLNLKIGIRYMITTNIDIEDGLVNGACGILKCITFKLNTEEPVQLWLDFESNNIGIKARLPFMNIVNREKIENSLTPISKISIVLNISKKINFQVIRKQFPVTPAEAVTIHKSQGQSCETICVDFNSIKRLTRPMLYVALSRVTSLAGLYILGNFRLPKSTANDNIIDQELNRLREKKQIPSLSEFENSPGLKIVYLNICSLASKIKNVTRDMWYHHADIIIFSETLTNPNSKIQMDNFSQIFRSDATEKSRGLLIVGRKENIIVDKHITDTERSAHVELISLKINENIIVTGYKSPKFSSSKFEANFKNILNAYIINGEINENVTIIGDFNIDIRSEKNCNLSKIFTSYNLKCQLNKDIQTTNLRSQIDVIFSNAHSIKVGTHETYFSYHKAIYAILNLKANNESDTNLATTNKNKETVVVESEEKSFKETKKSVSKNVKNKKSYENFDQKLKFNYPEIKKNEIVEAMNIRNLTESETETLLCQNGYLEDSHMDLFAEILNYHTSFTMQSVLHTYLPENIKQVPFNQPNLQILYSNSNRSDIGHWVCTYYDGLNNHIYDSINTMELTKDQEIYLNRLYPANTENIFHRVQQQLNPYDCGLFAIAFAVSISFGRNPENERYVAEKMRSHAAKIFSRRSLKPFPTLP